MNHGRRTSKDAHLSTSEIQTRGDFVRVFVKLFNVSKTTARRYWERTAHLPPNYRHSLTNHIGMCSTWPRK